MSEPEVIPVGNQHKHADGHSKFRHLIDAISHIEQLSVMELSGQEIPPNFFTTRDRVNFFHAGFGNGLVEGVCFGVLTSVTLPIGYDPLLAMKIEPYFPLVMSTFFLNTINCLPLVIAFGMCTYLNKFNTGKLTNRAVVALLTGRSFSLFIKGVLLYVLFIGLHRITTKENVMQLASYFALKNVELAETIYRVVMNLRPHIIPTAYTTLVIFLTAMITPFFTTWITSLYRSSIKKKAAAFWLAE
jgi:hypothetical protein